jgi:membrane protein DedA with SNARE-associated domain
VPIDAWLATIPPLAVYLAVGVVVGIESLGVPLPGEVVLVGAALLSTRPEVAVSPVWVALAALVGAVVGDSIGYSVGRRYGVGVLQRIGRRSPKHAGPAQLALAERAFARWGALTVIVGRFIALLRIFAGPLAGALRMPYAKFLPANILGALLWTAGTTAGIYFIGMAAETWLHRFSVVGLVVAVAGGLIIGYLVKKRAAAVLAEGPPSSTAESDPSRPGSN